LSSAGQALLERLGPALGVGADDERLGLAPAALQQIEQPLADGVGVGVGGVGHHDDQDLAVRDGVAMGGGIERVDPIVFVGRPFKVR
jgi:hypothetical protein